MNPDPTARVFRGVPRRNGILALIVSVAALVAGCVPIQPAIPPGDKSDALGEPIGARPVREGGVLSMALSSEPDKLDPATSTSLYTRYVAASMCEKLYDLAPDGTIVPQLATALPAISPDGLTVTIPVRTDARFADGTALDAEAVRVTLDRNLTLPGSARKSELGPIDTVTVADPATVRITLKRPFAPLTAALADRAGMIVSPTRLKDPRPFAESPVCVGAFKFERRIPQTSIRLVRDPLYYAAREVHLSEIVYRIMSDANIRAANLRSGSVQVADTISPQDADALQREKGITLLQSASLGYQGITFNIGNADGVGKPVRQRETPIARDARVRRAFQMTLDRAAMVNSVFNNWHEAACSAISPASPYATPASNACPPYDPAAARKILIDAGYTLPVRVELSVATSPDSQRYAQAVQASARAGGFDVAVRPVEYSTLLDVQARGTFDAVLLGWSGRVDPDANLAAFLASGAVRNYSGYSDPEVDRLLTDAARTNDQGERARLYGLVTTKVHEDVPIVYGYRMRNLTAYVSDVAGVRTYADGVVRLERAAFLAEKE
ncbi:ABC transporter substrate-binding protein [Tsukamurella spumae]|uniref:ABC transporter substrate-binding protein n=1 Tax=Tsukamurella spumae TaxID=44753 RepID=A0A846X378_9ACTN|nr:ABC transporter substrate-binding protein [Tsukamurella spumae]NKY18975.1 ABC transporter substrate-binding protein [Tsukamurella spumae]